MAKIITSVCFVLWLSAASWAGTGVMERTAVEYAKRLVLECGPDLAEFWVGGKFPADICDTLNSVGVPGDGAKITGSFQRHFPGMETESWVIAVERSGKKYHILVPFNGEGKVVGTFIHSGQSAVEQGVPYAGYRAKKRYSLPFRGEWFVGQGGKYEVLNHHLAAWKNRCGNAFAYDFIKLTPTMKAFDGPKGSPSSYPSFGEDVLAMTDGTVVGIVDGIADTKVGTHNFMHQAGNLVLIDHGNSEYSAVAHLQNGSIIVKPGQKVRQGDVIAKCGNSGEAFNSMPHIHIQLQNGPAFCDADSLPFGFSNVSLDGRRVKYAMPAMGNMLQAVP